MSKNGKFLSVEKLKHFFAISSTVEAWNIHRLSIRYKRLIVGI